MTQIFEMVCLENLELIDMFFIYSICKKYLFSQEIGLLFNTLRTATVESATVMEVLVIGKEDFEKIFLKADNPDDEPDHLTFLRLV